MFDDLHFLRRNMTVVLGSTSSEGWAWLELTDEERGLLGEDLLEQVGAATLE
jgi:hypothetical protein